MENDVTVMKPRGFDVALPLVEGCPLSNVSSMRNAKNVL